MGWGGAGEGVGGAVRLLEPVRWDVREGVGHRGRAESWASSGKRGMDTPVHFRAVWHNGSGMTVSFTACVTGRGFQPFCLTFLTYNILG